VYDFVFEGAGRIKFHPGQYMEWTLAHKKPDTRGNRRYFTIASSPEENNVLLGVKFYDQPSTYKLAMLKMNVGDKIVAGQMAGDFTLPDNKKQKLVFLAGGIGVTPFRSMIQHLLDTKQPRPITVLYSNRSANEIAYADIFMQARQELDIKTIYTLTGDAPADWAGYRGYINAEMVSKEIPDYRERTFYISGSDTMVKACKNLLLKMGVSRTRIKTDFFPGLA
jgi:glycine betaine catabolism B